MEGFGGVVLHPGRLVFLGVFSLPESGLDSLKISIFRKRLKEKVIDLTLTSYSCQSTIPLDCVGLDYVAITLL